MVYHVHTHPKQRMYMKQNTSLQLLTIDESPLILEEECVAERYMYNLRIEIYELELVLEDLKKDNH